jgi:ABC-type uncharacterized transport system substrate-binding protein
MRGMLDRKILAVVLIITLVLVSACSSADNRNSRSEAGSASDLAAEAEKTNKTYKILHVMSYHTPWEWTDTQLEGFKNALQGVNVDYRVFQMDSKNYSTASQKLAKAEQALEVIETWKPDLLYFSDDDALNYVGKHHAGTDLPMVFSAVNNPLSKYGIDQASNITGVMEIEHFLESVKLLKEVVPEARKIAVVFDEDPMWEPMKARMESQLSELPEMEFVDWVKIGSFKQYKEKMMEYQSTVDAVALIGIFTFQDDQGINMHYRDVLRWTAENSQLPDFSFWKDRATYGTLVSVSISGYEQGHEAGKLARKILVDGVPSADLPILSSRKGEPWISKARADDLGIRIKSSTLLSSQIETEYQWLRTP